MDTKLISPVSGVGQSVAPSRLQEASVPPQSSVKTPRSAEAPINVIKVSEQPALEQTDRSREKLGELVDELNTRAQSNNRTLRFSVDEKLGRSVISVVDRETDEVIRQIPPETALQIAHAFDEIAAGNLISDLA